MDTAGISIVIRTFNSARTLPKVLSQLSLRGSDEVVVVDSGSADKTLGIACDQKTIIVNAPPPFNYSKSLNLGFQVAKNAFVLVLSSHATPQSADFLDRYRRELESLPEDVAVIYGSSTTSGKVKLKSNKEEEISFYDSTTVQEILSLCGNGNALYRRQAWEKYPFDETIRTAEDKIWLETILLEKLRFAFLPTVPTLNQNQASLRYMYLKGYGDAKAFSRTVPYRPMNLYQLGGALKNHTLKRLKGEIDHGNWLRYTAHIFGQFFGSHGPGNNRPCYFNGKQNTP